MTEIQIIAHRGASAYEPENTLKAVEMALELGADFIEVDARLSRDGEIAIVHDETVDRTTNGEGLVKEMTVDQLKKLDAGSGGEIPTLKEVLDLVKGRGNLIIEIKVPEAVEKIVQEVRGTEMVGQVLISSFYHEATVRAKELEPSLKTGVIFSSLPVEPSRLALDAKADALIPKHSYVDDSMVSEARNRSLKVYPWTVDDLGEAKRLIDLGSSGIVTNKPDLLRKV